MQTRYNLPERFSWTEAGHPSGHVTSGGERRLEEYCRRRVLHGELCRDSASERMAEQYDFLSWYGELIACVLPCRFSVELRRSVGRPAVQAHIAAVLCQHHLHRSTARNLFGPIDLPDGEVCVSVKGDQ